MFPIRHDTMYPAGALPSHSSWYPAMTTSGDRQSQRSSSRQHDNQGEFLQESTFISPQAFSPPRDEITLKQEHGDGTLFASPDHDKGAKTTHPRMTPRHSCTMSMNHS